jgi:hypothetical protein
VYKPTKVFNWRRLWQFRYRVYAVVLALLVSTVLWSANDHIKSNIAIPERSLESVNIFVQKIGGLKYVSAQSTPKLKPVIEIDESDTELIQYYQTQGYTVKVLKKSINPLESEKLRQDALKKQQELEDQKKLLAQKPENQKTLDELLPIPETIQQTNILRYPKYDITAPIVYSTLADIFEKNSDGSINTSKPIDENIARDGPLGHPIQKLLVNGIVHMAFSPLPGELSEQMSSYIVGHSSNYPSVKSDYNYIFKPLESTTQPGEEFIIYDHVGRELKFKVFETEKISEEDATEAYKAFPGRRVVTLQTSILGYKNGQLAATHRWLTRGELEK